MGESIRITTPYKHLGTELHINGNKIERLTSFCFRHDVGECPRLEIQMLAVGAVIEGEGDVIVKYEGVDPRNGRHVELVEKERVE